MEETKERNMDLRSSKSGVRTDRRHKRDPRICPEKRDNKDSGLRINESHQTHDHKESYADIQRARDVEMQQQGRHESESKNKVKRNSGYQDELGDESVEKTEEEKEEEDKEKEKEEESGESIDLN